MLNACLGTFVDNEITSNRLCVYLMESSTGHANKMMFSVENIP